MSLFRNPIVIVVASLLVVGCLVAVLFLPPIALVQRLFSGIGYTELTADKSSINLPEGLAVAADPSALNARVTVKLTAIPNGVFLNKRAGSEWQPAAKSLPSYLILTGPV